MKDTIAVETLRYHQWDNRDRHVGDRYEIPADPIELLDTLVGQGLVRVLPDEQRTETQEQPSTADTLTVKPRKR